MGQNIFLENGFDDEEATVLSLESEAAIAIAHFISVRFPGNQVAASKHLRIGQNEVSSILNGNIGRFSLPKLIKIARRAGLRLYIDTGEDAHGTSVSVLPSRPVVSPSYVSEMELPVDFQKYDMPLDSVAGGLENNTKRKFVASH